MFALHRFGRLRKAGGLLLASSALATYGLATTGPASATGSAHYTIVYEAQLTGASNGAPAAPEAPAAFKAAFAGQPVTVDVCDDQGTTTGNIDCEHEAVTDHAAAYVVTQSNEDQSLVDSANIPVVGVANDTSPQSFDLSAQQGLFAGMAVALEKRGCKRLGTVIVEGGQSYANQSAKAVKWQSVTDSFIALAAPDLSPDIAKLVQAHVQCIDLATIGSQIGQALTAIKQANLHVPIAVPGIVVTPQVQSSLGSLGNGLIMVESTPALNSPAVAKVAKKMHAVSKSITVDANSLDSWAIAIIIQDAAVNIHGAVTNTTLLAALNKLRGAATDGLYPPISMKPQPNPAALRDFDTYVQTFILHNGKLTQPSGFFNVGPEINVALTNS
jgi:hypothetical protein